MSSEQTARVNNEGQRISLMSQPAAILLVAVWLGVLAGLGEVLVAAAGKFVLHRYTHQSVHIAWMVPIADAAILAIPGLIFACAIWRWRNLTSVRIAIFVLSLLGFATVLLRVTWLKEYAILALAFGLAVQTSRLVAQHLRGFYKLVQRTVGLLVAIVALLAIGVYWAQDAAEHRALAKLPSFKPESPNVILIVMDTVRAQSLSMYGYSRPTTPVLEQLAKTGVRFDRAISTAPWTLPSHSSMFTGRYPHELSVGWFATLDSTYRTLAETLSDRGYLTAGFVANTIYCSRESGLSRGFAHYEDFSISPMQILLNSALMGRIADSETVTAMGYDEVSFGRKTAQKINHDFLSWLSYNETKRPFFAFLNYLDAHSPYSAPEPFDSMFAARTRRVNPHLKPSDQWSDSEVQAELDAYDSAIAYLDHQLGLLFQELRSRNLLENTLVIVTSDHGEEFYEHGVMAHGWSTYLSSLHVPLVIAFPGTVPSGTIVNSPVTMRDLPATVIDLLKLDPSAGFPGSSLARYWHKYDDSDSIGDSLILSELSLQTPEVPERYPILKGQGSLESLVVNQYHYIKTHDGREELYDLVRDQWEEHDLAGTEEAQRIVQSIRAKLETKLAWSRGTN